MQEDKAIGVLYKYAPKDTLKWLRSSILAWVNQYNVKQSMSVEQIISTADLIVEEFPIFTVHDFARFFRKSVTGRFGKVYERLDASVLLEQLREFAGQRAEQVEDILRKRKHQESEQAEVDTELALKHIKIIKEKLQQQGREQIHKQFSTLRNLAERSRLPHQKK